MPRYNLTEYSDNYSKSSGSLWLYYRDQLNDILTKKPGNTPADSNTKGVKIAFSLKYLIHFRRTLEILLINCQTNLINLVCRLCYYFCNWGKKITVTDTKHFVPV